MVRHAVDSDLEQLLQLYQHLHPSDPPLTVDTSVRQLWSQILADNKVHVLVAVAEAGLVASCVLMMVPNLTRGARPFGLIENVVTHAQHRRKGYGRRVLEGALAIAWRNDCYKVMLMTGNASTLQFYRHCGFVQGVKTGLVAYPGGIN
ncbi:MAG: GNAT family N-acetyltransferase [Candidatus Marsarchaeota archaeon]|nr:GNAT family N-acetyltransferase [Candidatus Marsarchaeota archaeon]